jgi:hypothetical protein
VTAGALFVGGCDYSPFGYTQIGEILSAPARWAATGHPIGVETGSSLPLFLVFSRAVLPQEFVGLSPDKLLVRVEETRRLR